ncbi:MAG TPA: hypothetical protein ENI62_14970 [Gammaproteobacteria bacterium]|nr:hypothetical protein [Gammaproteobacteria bacterium]
MFKIGKILLAVILSSFAAQGFAKDYRISVAKLPLYSESPTKGILIDVLKAMGKEYQGGKFIIEVYPFERSINNVINGQADLHFPTIGPTIWGRENDRYEKKLNKMGLRRSTSSLTKTHFALYSNSDKPPIDLTRLETYRIETDLGHTTFFYPGIQGTTCLPCSVKKLSAGRIDGLIFAAREIDFFIKKAGITNIRRQNYRIFGSKFILPIGKKGDEIDQLLSKLIIKMIKDGSLARAAAPYLGYFKKEFGGLYIPQLSDIPN